ncbi:hypothetical protein A3SI_00010 [Nitritalea halalkaliphila LW7]|uniref:Bacteroidetes-specific membrane protein n=1 Tax=Nitritalea halalkaliphila LW7 TaxID=1189621 RepID=I5CAH8_9BACT|nr:type IX secretion system membrane protein PorP/SprF [Nitritalea halalkaliphila]EIM78830.1 hypothetical protein A3SI_00010 [Nitritalea halalkaliphila LW7]
MKRKSIFLLALVLQFFLEANAQQVPQYSQYMFNPIFINPAYTGYKDQLFLQSYYRKQWVGLEGAPETFVVAADGFIPDKNLGIGVIGMSDRLGMQRTSALYANISYRLQLGQYDFLQFGIGVGMVNAVLDGGLAETTNPDDPTVPVGRNDVLYPDLKAGVFYFNERFYFGAAFDNLLSPILDFDNGQVIAEPRSHLFLTGGSAFALSDNIDFRPSFFWMDDYRSPARVDLTTNFSFYERLWVGATYRTSVDYANRSLSPDLQRATAVVAMFQVFLTEGLRIGYAYDHNITGFNVRNFTTHDISLGFMLQGRRVGTVSPRYF